MILNQEGPAVSKETAGSLFLDVNEGIDMVDPVVLEQAELELQQAYANGRFADDEQVVAVGTILFLEPNLGATVRNAIRDHDLDFLQVLFNCRSTFAEILRQEREEMAAYDPALVGAAEQVDAIINSRTIWNGYFPVIDRYLRITTGLENVDPNDLPQIREPMPEKLPDITIAALILVMRRFISVGIELAKSHDFGKAYYYFQAVEKCLQGVNNDDLSLYAVASQANFFRNLLVTQQASKLTADAIHATWSLAEQQNLVLSVYERLIVDMKQYFTEQGFFGHYLLSSDGGVLRQDPFYGEIYNDIGQFSDFEILRNIAMVPVIFRYPYVSLPNGQYYHQQDGVTTAVAEQFDQRIDNLNGEVSRAHQEAGEALVEQLYGKQLHAFTLNEISSDNRLLLMSYIFNKIALHLDSAIYWPNFRPDVSNSIHDIVARFAECHNQVTNLQQFVDTLSDYNNIPVINTFIVNMSKISNKTNATTLLLPLLDVRHQYLSSHVFSVQLNNTEPQAKIIADHYIALGKQYMADDNAVNRDNILQQLTASRTPQALSILFVLRQAELLRGKKSSAKYLRSALQYENGPLIAAYIATAFAEYGLKNDPTLAHVLYQNFNDVNTAEARLLSMLVKQNAQTTKIEAQLPNYRTLNTDSPEIQVSATIEPMTMADNGYGVFTTAYMRYRDNPAMQELHHSIAGLLLNNSEYAPQRALAYRIFQDCRAEGVIVDINAVMPQVNVEIDDDCCLVTTSLSFKRSDFSVMQYADHSGNRQKPVSTKTSRFSDLIVSSDKRQRAKDVVLRAHIALSLRNNNGRLKVVNELVTVNSYVPSLTALFNHSNLAGLIAPTKTPVYNNFEAELWFEEFTSKLDDINNVTDWRDEKILILGDMYRQYIDSDYRLYDRVRQLADDGQHGCQWLLNYLFNVKLAYLQDNNLLVQDYFAFYHHLTVGQQREFLERLEHSDIFTAVMPNGERFSTILSDLRWRDLLQRAFVPDTADNGDSGSDRLSDDEGVSQRNNFRVYLDGADDNLILSENVRSWFFDEQGKLRLPPESWRNKHTVLPFSTECQYETRERNRSMVARFWPNEPAVVQQLFGQLMIGDELPHSTIVKMEVPGYDKSLVVEIMPYVHGIKLTHATPLIKRIETSVVGSGNVEERCKLDYASFTRYLLLSLVANFDDAHLGNYFLQKIREHVYKLCMIDFESAGHQQKDKDRLKIKNALFFLHHMEHSKCIDKNVVEEFLSLDIDQLLRRWLELCQQENERLYRIFGDDIAILYEPNAYQDKGLDPVDPLGSSVFNSSMLALSVGVKEQRFHHNLQAMRVALKRILTPTGAEITPFELTRRVQGYALHSICRDKFDKYRNEPLSKRFYSACPSKSYTEYKLSPAEINRIAEEGIEGGDDASKYMTKLSRSYQSVMLPENISLGSANLTMRQMLRQRGLKLSDAPASPRRESTVYFKREEVLEIARDNDESSPRKTLQRFDKRIRDERRQQKMAKDRAVHGKNIEDVITALTKGEDWESKLLALTFEPAIGFFHLLHDRMQPDDQSIVELRFMANKQRLFNDLQCLPLSEFTAAIYGEIRQGTISTYLQDNGWNIKSLNLFDSRIETVDLSFQRMPKLKLLKLGNNSETLLKHVVQSLVQRDQEKAQLQTDLEGLHRQLAEVNDKIARYEEIQQTLLAMDDGEVGVVQAIDQTQNDIVTAEAELAAIEQEIGEMEQDQVVDVVALGKAIMRANNIRNRLQDLNAMLQQQEQNRDQERDELRQEIESIDLEESRKSLTRLYQQIEPLEKQLYYYTKRQLRVMLDGNIDFIFMAVNDLAARDVTIQLARPELLAAIVARIASTGKYELLDRIRNLSELKAIDLKIPNNFAISGNLVYELTKRGFIDRIRSLDLPQVNVFAAKEFMPHAKSIQRLRFVNGEYVPLARSQNYVAEHGLEFVKSLSNGRFVLAQQGGDAPLVVGDRAGNFTNLLWSQSAANNLYELPGQMLLQVSDMYYVWDVDGKLISTQPFDHQFVAVVAIVNNTMFAIHNDAKNVQYLYISTIGYYDKKGIAHHHKLPVGYDRRYVGERGQLIHTSYTAPIRGDWKKTVTLLRKEKSCGAICRRIHQYLNVDKDNDDRLLVTVDGVITDILPDDFKALDGVVCERREIDLRRAFATVTEVMVDNDFIAIAEQECNEELISLLNSWSTHIVYQNLAEDARELPNVEGLRFWRLERDIDGQPVAANTSPIVALMRNCVVDVYVTNDTLTPGRWIALLVACRARHVNTARIPDRQANINFFQDPAMAQRLNSKAQAVTKALVTELPEFDDYIDNEVGKGERRVSTASSGVISVNDGDAGDSGSEELNDDEIMEERLGV